MVEYVVTLDQVFGSLADTTRRDILERLVKKQMSVGEIAQPYNITFAAVSKHLKVLERAKLVVKRRQGKEQIVSLAPDGLAQANRYLEAYRQLQADRFAALDELLKKAN